MREVKPSRTCWRPLPETALLNLDADMVCLSAYETGIGERRKGDGMVGLSRVFMSVRVP